MGLSPPTSLRKLVYSIAQFLREPDSYHGH
jgi:hypothetical protein